MPINLIWIIACDAEVGYNRVRWDGCGPGTAGGIYSLLSGCSQAGLCAVCNPVHLPWEPMQQVIQYRVSAEVVMDEASRQGGPLSPVQAASQSRLADLGPYSILVEGVSDKVYLELAAQKHLEATGVDLAGFIDLLANARKCMALK